MSDARDECPDADEPGRRPGMLGMAEMAGTMRRRRLCAALAGLAVLGLVHGAMAEGKRGKHVLAWANDLTARLQALALLQTLNADLLSHDSATLTLDRWCDRLY